MPRPARRPALATVELVMVLPVLMLFAALVVKVGDVTRAKAEAVLDARAKVYTAAPGAEPDGLHARSEFGRETLDIDKQSFGMADATGRRTLGLRPVAANVFTARGRVRMLVGTWDHRGMPFPERSRAAFPVGKRAAVAAGVPNEAQSVASGIDGAAVAQSAVADGLKEQAFDQFGKMALQALGANNAFETAIGAMNLTQLIKNADKIGDAVGKLRELGRTLDAFQDLVDRVGTMFQDRLHADF